MKGGREVYWYSREEGLPVGVQDYIEIFHGQRMDYISQQLIPKKGSAQTLNAY